MSILLWWQLLQWREYVELSIFITIAWHALKLLNKDTQRPLIAITCGYFTTLFAAWYIQLTALILIMLISTPCLIALCMIMHQRTLQRALIAQPLSLNTEAWTEQLIKLSMHAFQRATSIVWIIEQKYTLTGALHNGIILHAPLSMPLLELILAQHTPHTPLILWLTADGKIHRIAPAYTEAVAHNSHDATLTAYAPWQRAALIMNRSLEACTIYSDATTRLFTLIANNKVYTDVSAPHALTMLKNIIPLSGKEHACNASSLSASDRSARASSGPASLA